MINAAFSRGLPPPQQQQMLSLRATNQPSLLNANPMLQRALLMQQMQGTVVMGDAYLLELFNHPSWTETIVWLFLAEPLQSLYLVVLFVVFFFFFSSSNLSIVHITEVLQLLKILCAQLFTTRNSTRRCQVRYEIHAFPLRLGGANIFSSICLDKILRFLLFVHLSWLEG